MSSVATLTVSGPTKYECSPTAFTFDENTKLTIIPPKEGCTICFSDKVQGATKYDIPGGTTKELEFKVSPKKVTIDFCTCELKGQCTPKKTEDGGHTITIDAGTR